MYTNPLRAGNNGAVWWDIHLWGLHDPYEHPIYRHFVRTGAGSARTISDFLIQPKLHEASGVGALRLDSRGRMREASGLGRLWAERYFGALRDGRMPAALAEWIVAQRGARNSEVPPPPRPLAAERDGAGLVARLLTRPRASLILLQEERITPDREALARLGLSRREVDVLAWVAEGKTNPEIATILRLSPRTVGNHLARIYTRLGVETRTAAARLALTAP